MGNLTPKEKAEAEKALDGYEEDLDSPAKSTKKIVGTDATYHVGDLLKATDRKVEYAQDPPKIVKEDLPVAGAFLLHNILTPDECKQYISISEEMGYELSPLRYLGTVNSDKFNMDTSIRNSERVLFD